MKKPAIIGAYGKKPVVLPDVATEPHPRPDAFTLLPEVEILPAGEVEPAPEHEKSTGTDANAKRG